MYLYIYIYIFIYINIYIYIYIHVYSYIFTYIFIFMYVHNEVLAIHAFVFVQGRVSLSGCSGILWSTVQTNLMQILCRRWPKKWAPQPTISLERQFLQLFRPCGMMQHALLFGVPWLHMSQMVQKSGRPSLLLGWSSHFLQRFRPCGMMQHHLLFGAAAGVAVGGMTMPKTAGDATHHITNGFGQPWGKNTLCRSHGSSTACRDVHFVLAVPALASTMPPQGCHEGSIAACMCPRLGVCRPAWLYVPT